MLRIPLKRGFSNFNLKSAEIYKILDRNFSDDNINDLNSNLILYADTLRKDNDLFSFVLSKTKERRLIWNADDLVRITNLFELFNQRSGVIEQYPVISQRFHELSYYAKTTLLHLLTKVKDKEMHFYHLVNEDITNILKSERNHPHQFGVCLKSFLDLFQNYSQDQIDCIIEMVEWHK